MTFDDLQAGDTVFLDANTLIYHFAKHPKYGASCTRLIERIELNELQASTSSHCLADVAHRLMTIEAIGRFGWPNAGIAARLRKHYPQISALKMYQVATAKVSQLGLHVFPLLETHVLAATTLSEKYELLTGDALLLAIMQQHGLTKLASADVDFDRAPTITRYEPA